ncbi:hypothetical protein AAC387_Pa07g1656 [Persea americana]
MKVAVSALGGCLCVCVEVDTYVRAEGQGFDDDDDICDLVTISRLLNATLVIREIQESTRSKGTRLMRNN